MKYRVIVQERAADDLVWIESYITVDAPLRAQTWVSGMTRRISTLSTMPKRCKVAPESAEVDFEVRCLNIGGYRVLFTIVGDTVQVLHVRHAARDYGFD